MKMQQIPLAAWSMEEDLPALTLTVPMSKLASLLKASPERDVDDLGEMDIILLSRRDGTQWALRQFDFHAGVQVDVILSPGLERDVLETLRDIGVRRSDVKWVSDTLREVLAEVVPTL